MDRKLRDNPITSPSPRNKPEKTPRQKQPHEKIGSLGIPRGISVPTDAGESK